jgi:protein-tyrosine phosphatase
MTGLVDVHCHLLWGIDDGCRSPDDALAAARALAAAGFAEAAQTPHARADFPSQDAALCEARFVELAALLQREGVPLVLHRGAENFLDEGFLERVARGEPRGLGAGRYVLVELPFAGAVPRLPDLLFRIRLKGLVPVVAHPEHCAAATDLHDPVDAERWVAEALRAVERRAGAAEAGRLCRENPGRMLRGEELA